MLNKVHQAHKKLLLLFTPTPQPKPTYLHLRQYIGQSFGLRNDQIGFEGHGPKNFYCFSPKNKMPSHLFQFFHIMSFKLVSPQMGIYKKNIMTIMTKLKLFSSKEAI